MKRSFFGSTTAAFVVLLLGHVPVQAAEPYHLRIGWVVTPADLVTSDAASFVDIGAVGGNAPDDILGSQYRCHRSPP